MAASPQLNKLRFSICNYSSEDEAFPVTELLHQTPQTKGWQSAKLCEYPQEITIQFEGEVRMSQIQFLSHESKIATKIEIFVAKPSPIDREKRTFPRPENCTFHRLGYLSLDSNVKSNFRARELKTVHINAEAMYLRLCLHKCHINNFNLYSQVGLVAVSLLGELVTPFSPRELPMALHSRPPLGGAADFNLMDLKPKSVSAASPLPDLTLDVNFDPQTAQRIRDLAILKEKAVQEEDYDEAKNIKNAIDHLRGVGVQLAELEALKKAAVRNEDYDRAKQIKQEIDRLRQGAEYPPRSYAPPQPLSRPSSHKSGALSLPGSSGAQMPGVHDPFPSAKRVTPRIPSPSAAIAPLPTPAPAPRSPLHNQPPIPSISSRAAPKKDIPPEKALSSSAEEAFGQTQSEEEQARIQYVPYDERPAISKKPPPPEEDPSSDRWADAPELSATPVPLAPVVKKKPAPKPKPVVVEEDEGEEETPAPRSMGTRRRVVDDKPVVGGHMKERGAAGGARSSGAGGFSTFDLADKPEWEAHLIIAVRKGNPQNDLPVQDESSSIGKMIKDHKVLEDAMGSYLVQIMHSKTWQHRELAFKTVAENMHVLPGETIGEAAVFLACCRAVLNVLTTEKVAHVILAAMDMLMAAVERAQSARLKRAEITNALEPALSPLIAKTGDSNVRTRDSAFTAVIALSQSFNGMLGPLICGNLIKLSASAGASGEGAGSKSSASATAAAANNPKLLLSRLQLLTEIIRSTRMAPSSGLSTEPIMSLVVTSMQNPNGDVRSAAVALAAEVYRSCKYYGAGTKGAPRPEFYLKDQKAAIQDMCKQAFSNIDMEEEEAMASEGGGGDGGGRRVRSGPPPPQEFDEMPAKGKAGGGGAKGGRIPPGGSSPAKPNGNRKGANVGGSSMDNDDVTPRGKQTQKPAAAASGGKEKEQQKRGKAAAAPPPPVEEEEEEQQQEDYYDEQQQAVQDSGPDPVEQFDSTCQFCGMYDPASTPAKMDLHYCNLCPMLTTCYLCGLVIEIETMNSHLLEECESRSKVKKCGRCMEPVLNELYKEHVASKSCNAARSEEECGRCPLCHVDISPNTQEAWRSHLVGPCQHNPRIGLQEHQPSATARGAPSARKGSGK